MREKIKLQPVIDPKPNPCLHCPDPPKIAPMDMHIAVGFGSAFLTANGDCVWDEQMANDDYEKCMTVADAEKLAAKEPHKDWMIHKHGPLHGEVYQRQGPKHWVCIEQDEGFA
jgi:hypothetical protein